MRGRRAVLTPGLELRHCRALVAVADHGGPTRAAAALGVSQSTVSEALLALERVVGAPLVVRGGRPEHDAAGADRTGTRPARLTGAGTALLPHARALLAAADAALAAARDAARAAGDDDAPYVVPIGAAESVSTYVLPPVLAALRARWPRAEVQVSTGLCEELRARVAAGQLDAALVLEPEGEPEIASTARPVGRPVTTAVLGPARIALVVAPARGDRRGRPRRITATELARAVLYASDPGGAYHAVLAGYLAARGVAPRRVRSAGSVDAVKRSVLGATPADGAVIGVVSAHAVVEELRAGVLEEVCPTEPLPAVYLKVVVRGGAPPAPFVAALIDALRGTELRGARAGRR